MKYPGFSLRVLSQGSEEVFAIDPLPPRPASVDNTRDNVALLPRSPPHPHPQVPAVQDDEDAEGMAHEVRLHAVCVHACVHVCSVCVCVSTCVRVCVCRCMSVLLAAHCIVTVYTETRTCSCVSI